ncbi:hypothetical protein GQ44DRAFT_771261 [Phaeosphaeriaceae sp. PMI808]|nr:hypothetical protein GQ44DRAFT_771261 [Phaeosphaeriaceae sp. PMI808]
MPIIAQDSPSASLALLRHMATSLTSLLLPDTIRQEWSILLSRIYYSIASSPAAYRNSALILVLLATIAEWEQPGFLLRPLDVQNYLVGFVPIGLFTFSVFAMLDAYEMGRWMWEDSRWEQWWEQWLWDRGMDDTGVSVYKTDQETPFPQKNEVRSRFDSSPPHAQLESPDCHRQVMPPPLLPSPTRNNCITPPTPYLSSSLHAPSSLGLCHGSGILGASPMPPRRFENFSGEGLLRRQANLNAIAEWSGPNSTYLRDVDGYSGLNQMGTKTVREAEEEIINTVGDGENGVIEGEKEVARVMCSNQRSNLECDLIDLRE